MRPLEIRPSRRNGAPALAALLGGWLLLASVPGWAQQNTPQANRSIYSCVTGDGRKLTSDRPIPECAHREQRMLNADGSTKRMVPPAMSPEEMAAADARKRVAEAERVAQMDAVRRDRNLLSRYRDEAAHAKAREAALDDIREAMKLSERRITDLAAERKPLQEEAEFYKGKAMPMKLRLALETNDTAAQAQRDSIENQRSELNRVNRLFDDELARLRRLWAGAAPGSAERTTGSAANP